MELSKNLHSNENDRVKNGSFFTPDSIVSIAVEWLTPYLTEDTAIIDFGVGYGAFISRFIEMSNNLYATDNDRVSCDFVSVNFPSIKVFYENSLLNITRDKYAINDDQELMVIGNPPYNDITSQYKKGNKGSTDMDEDVKARDLGISFLKMYDKINAKYICVLHPLSYLIKKANFNSLGDFKNNYILKKATIFSSEIFENIASNKSSFPVVIALYERSETGMRDFSFIRDFKFGVLNSNKKFCLGSIQTIDGKVDKYPTKDKQDTDLQFYTIRDINALKRNKTFLVGHCNNGVKVDIQNLYLYAWLDYFKYYFKPNNEYLYGNLSPLYSDEIEKTEVKKEIISYIIQTNGVVKMYYEEKMHTLFDYYKLNEQKTEYPNLERIIAKLNNI